MAEQILPDFQAPVNIVQFAATNGVPAMLLRATVRALRAAGQRCITLEIDLAQDEDAAGRVDANAPQAQEDWLTPKQAALLLMKDSPALSLQAAFARVSEGASRDRFRWVGSGRKRRIDPSSYDAWRLARRDRLNDRAEKS